MDKKYEEALKSAKKIYQGKYKPEVAVFIAEKFPLIFPELAETKAERIRKMLYGWVCIEPDSTFDGGYSKQEVLAWLDKQEPVEIDDDDEATLETWESIIKDKKDEWQLSDWFVEATSLLVQKVKHIKQGPIEWSEEDKRNYSVILEILKCWENGTLAEHIIPPTARKYIDWFESLYPQKQYDPYKAAVESNAEMCDKYSPSSDSRAEDTRNTIKFKCKDTVDY